MNLNYHPTFCSCADCIDFRHEKRVSAMQREYRESYDLPRKRRSLKALWHVLAGLILFAAFLLLWFGTGK